MRLLFTAISCFISFSALAELTGPHYFNDPNGNNREYYLYVPLNLPENSPLVFSLHGWGGSGLSMSSYGSFNSLAESQNFLVLSKQSEVAISSLKIEITEQNGDI